MQTEHMDTAQPSKLACLPQELQSHNDAQVLLLLQDYVGKLSHTQRTLEATYVFFSSSLADVALWLGPYMSISGKTSLCTRTKTVWKCRQITTTTTTHNPARRPANPPARLAFRQEKQQTRQTKGAGAQTKTTTKKICQRTQWFDHCIILKNMRK